jgi:hypothetical protein
MNKTSEMIPQRYVYAATLVTITMMAAILWMPAMLGALAPAYDLDTSKLSNLAFIELLGFLTATLFTSSKSVAQLKYWVLMGCLLIIASNAWIAIHNAHAPDGAARLIAGLGAGLAFGYGLKVCTMSARPTQSFGILTGSMSIMMIAGFQFVAYLLETRASVAGAVQPELVKGVAGTLFGTYAVVAVLSAWVLWTNQPPVSRAQVAESKRRGVPSRLVVVGLIAIGVAFIGQGSIWAFLQTLGASHGFSVAAVANAMSAFAIMGIAGSFSAAMTPARVPRWVANGAALIVLWGGLYALYSPQSIAWYVAGCAVGGFYWNFILPLILGLLARLDDSGQGSVLGGTMSSVGSALGPLLAGRLIHHADYRPVGWMAGALCLVSLICVWQVERRSNTARA